MAWVERVIDFLWVGLSRLFPSYHWLRKNHIGISSIFQSRRHIIHVSPAPQRENRNVLPSIPIKFVYLFIIQAILVGLEYKIKPTTSSAKVNALNHVNYKPLAIKI